MSYTEVEKFDPSTLMQGVKDRIKAAFVSMIPDEQWEGMISKEVNEYFYEKKDPGYRRDRATDFQLMAQKVIEDEVKKRIAEYLVSGEFINTWTNNGEPVVTEKIKIMLIDNSGVILSNMMGAMFATALESFKVQLTSNQYR